MLAERLPYDDPMSESWLAIYAMIHWSAIIGQRVIRLLLCLGLQLTEEQLGKFPTTIILLKYVLETLCVLRIHGKI